MYHVEDQNTKINAASLLFCLIFFQWLRSTLSFGSFIDEIKQKSLSLSMGFFWADKVVHHGVRYRQKQATLARICRPLLDLRVV